MDENYRKALFSILSEKGLKYYKEYGLLYSERVKMDSREYFDSMDTIGNMLNKILEYKEKSSVELTKLYEIYQSKIENKITITKFSQSVKGYGVYEIYRSHGKTRIKNYIIQENYEELINTIIEGEEVVEFGIDIENITAE
jgi:hypothetical protein